jgi:hypothetical protein
MSHFEAESSDEAVEAGFAASWAAMARGITTANARTEAHPIDFETRECMRLSSATDLNDQ